MSGKKRSRMKQVRYCHYYNFSSNDFVFATKENKQTETVSITTSTTPIEKDATSTTVNTAPRTLSALSSIETPTTPTTIVIQAENYSECGSDELRWVDCLNLKDCNETAFYLADSGQSCTGFCQQKSKKVP